VRKLISVLIIIGLFFIAGCANSPKPDSTVSDFIKAAKTFDLVKMASKINPANSANKEKISDLIKDDKKDQYQKYFLDYIKLNATKITYKIKDTKIDNQTAYVTVDFKYVNGGPLLKATIADVLPKAMSMAFTGVEMTEQETSQMFVSAMQKQKESVPESFTEKTIDIKCIKVDNQWYIDELSENLLDVIMSNFVSVGKEFNNATSSNTTSNSANEASNTISDQAKKDNMTIIKKAIGEEVILATINLNVKRVEEKQTITPTYGSPKVAKEGAKFVVINLEITNTTNKVFSFPPDLMIVDNKGREFKSYSDSIGGIDNYLDYRELPPSIKETGNLVYELPTDATNYNLVSGKTGTNELYQILLK
jgi:hypothetical protein